MIGHSPRTVAAAMDEDDLAYHAFLKAARRYWAGPILRSVARTAALLRADELSEALREDPSYTGLAWLESSLQRQKYAGPHGLLAIARRDSESLNDALDAAQEAKPGRLRLAADQALPDYYTEADFHRVPDGIYSRPTDGFVYEHAAGSTAMMGNEKRDLHAELADRIASACKAPGNEPTVLDVGCGFGKLEGFLGQVLAAHVRVIGCDLSAPALRLAHLRALERGQVATWVQSAAEDMSWCPNASIDVVTSVQLLHELPRGPRLQALAEANRVLRPGGQLMMIDFYPVDVSEFEMFLFRGHTVRNNEPYLQDLLESPLAADLVSSGFADPSIVSMGGQPPSGAAQTWRLPWALVTASKP